MAERLKKSILYTFGVADLGFSLMVSMETYFFAAFLTDYAKYPLGVAGQILTATSFIDIACAILAGIILQKVTLRFGGKYRSWLLVGPPVVAVLFILQFTKIGSDTMGAFIVMFAFVASHLLWNTVYTANVSMVGRLSQLPDERTILSASRGQYTAAAGLIFSYIAMPIITFIGARTNPVAGYTYTVAIFGVVMILAHWYNYRITAGKDPYDEAVVVGNKEAKQSIGEILAQVFKNPPLLFLILADIFRNTYSFIIMGFAFYYFKYVLNNLAFLPIFLLSINIAAFLGSLIGGKVGVSLGKRNSYILSMLIPAGILVLAKFIGSSTIVFTVLICLVQFTARIAYCVITALFSDTVVYGEWKTGKNTRGFIMSLLTFPIKAGVFIRSFIMSVGLVAIGYVANAAPTPGVVSGISTIMTVLPAIACFLAAGIFSLGYKIDDKRVVEMQEEIAARKAKEVAGV
ncbi:MAG: glycoside-pentoside-hexuronide (GPH):cation symporter [Clostridiales bacterium]|jgi:sugar (glycoside-pentoside-hexuronide) transporter|nr:glycoside-pentoside-hexuronide (GPH):cation symporter [Eubacteriales bacterium]MDH7567913.1 glycoside-pentoside-hexuronide (GPH):cation symporter [Clostridiales bacterium]